MINRYSSVIKTGDQQDLSVRDFRRILTTEKYSIVNDGYTNLQEYEEDTDPNNADSNSRNDIDNPRLHIPGLFCSTHIKKVHMVCGLP